MIDRGTSGGDGWTDAWSARYGADEAAPAPRPAWRRFALRGRLGGGSRSGRYAVAAAALLATVSAPFAVAQGGGSVQGSTARFESQDDRYTELVRNTRDGDGGAAAHACDSDASAPGAAHEPCLNMVNKGSGFAAAFRTRGLVGFRLQTSGSGTATPFVLDANATGRVQYLNADTVDGRDSTEIGRERFALVNGNVATPAFVRQNGATAVTRPAAGSYRVAFTDDVNTCVFQATSADVAANRTLAAVVDPENAKQVIVNVRRAGGANEGELVNSDFQLTVNC